MGSLDTPSRGSEEGAAVVGLALVVPLPVVVVLAPSGKEGVGLPPPTPDISEFLAVVTSLARVVAWLEQVSGPRHIVGAPTARTSQALVRLGGGSSLQGDSPPFFADRDDLRLEAFELDEVAEWEEWNRVWGVYSEFQWVIHGAMTKMGDELASASQVSFYIPPCISSFPALL